MPDSWPGYRLLSDPGSPTVSCLMGLPVGLPAEPPDPPEPLAPLWQAARRPASDANAAEPAPARSTVRRLIVDSSARDASMESSPAMAQVICTDKTTPARLFTENAQICNTLRSSTVDFLRVSVNERGRLAEENGDVAQRTRRRLPKRTREQTRALMLRAATELVCARLQDTGDEALSAALAHVQLTEVA